MQVSVINKNNYNTQNFQGTVDKSIKKYINNHVNVEIKNSLKVANKIGQAINQNYLIGIKTRSTKITTKLEEFMSKLHPNTILKADEAPFRRADLYLQNKKDKIYIIESDTNQVGRTEVFLKNAKPMCSKTGIEINDLDINNILNKMSNFTDEFTALDAKQIDEAMLTKKFYEAKFEIKNFYKNESFFNFGLKMKKTIDSLYKYAKDIGKIEEAKTNIEKEKQQIKLKVLENNAKKRQKEEEKNKIRLENNSFVKNLLK